MAAFVKAINAKIRSNPTLSYFCSTHFWGPASNFGIPIAAIADAQKSPDLISGQMTAALTVYSATFMRYSLAVTPKNYLLFACHFINECSQLTQGYRFVNWHYWGGKEKALQSGALTEAKEKVVAAGEKVKEAVSK
ncbi:hypothetical protein JX265_005350 [Neoarthrinium moseri]|uniref:Mitochondrial pyruvate carrier n=1 Tax=Neoarthrinium moseri TaxID=1658444 RepID=A0A9P9WNJ2_9PEZI|nr:uncharacterized protein JN550_006193 [Neoarthrinium moseri]KAI1845660.1 hypothetical protein JX266_008271 [Neoarthrinium moseri]KAI1868618.1 hypothetical protein JN550_006193 [Neoarthrinium moseri]KAI1872470.1 hypothetical protein JX265_005350 [Neoarthrinium moseri]